jgi:hypothetical protein
MSLELSQTAFELERPDVQEFLHVDPLNAPIPASFVATNEGLRPALVDAELSSTSYSDILPGNSAYLPSKLTEAPEADVVVDPLAKPEFAATRTLEAEYIDEEAADIAGSDHPEAKEYDPETFAIRFEAGRQALLAYRAAEAAQSAEQTQRQAFVNRCRRIAGRVVLGAMSIGALVAGVYPGVHVSHAKVAPRYETTQDSNALDQAGAALGEAIGGALDGLTSPAQTEPVAPPVTEVPQITPEAPRAYVLGGPDLATVSDIAVAALEDEKLAVTPPAVKIISQRLYNNNAMDLRLPPGQDVYAPDSAVKQLQPGTIFWSAAGMGDYLQQHTERGTN